MRASLWVVIVAVVAACCLPVIAMASDSRVESLLPEVASRSYIEDYILFREFPTVAARYARLVTAGLGTRSNDGTDKTVGVIGAGDNTNYGVFALYLNQMSPSQQQDQAELDLAWAKQFTSIALGARLNWSKSKFDDTANNTTTPVNPPALPFVYPEDYNTLGITGGVKFDLGSNGMMELAGTLAWLTFENQNTGVQDAGNVSYNIAGRIFTDLSDKTSLVPLLRYGSMDLSREGDAEKTKQDNLNLGVALQRIMNGDDLFIVGIALNYMKTQNGSDVPFDVAGIPLDPGQKRSSWQLPELFIALEFDVYSWLTGRVGASKTFANTSEEPINGGESATLFNGDFQFGLGMGLHFNNFDVDANVNPESLFTGGYLFSGEASQPIGRITATYYW